MSILVCAVVFACGLSDVSSAQIVDCNSNGVADNLDISSGGSIDCNGNGIPDECECLADDNDNGIADVCETGICGCMDIVFVVDDTVSMVGAINRVKNGLDEIIDAATFAAGADPLLGGDPNNLRMALVTFKDVVEVDLAFTSSLVAIENAVDDLTTSGGAGLPEASDEALRLVINNMVNCGSGSIGTFRSDCQRIVILVTDQLPGGCDDSYQVGVDDVAAAQLANDAAAAGILVSAVYVPTTSTNPAAIAIMQNYATVTGGQYVLTASNGDGTDQGISQIIEMCGESLTDCNNNGIADDCDIEQGRSLDCNENGIPDECELGDDTDGDGVLDECDGCPFDPDKIEPGVCGCGVADTDSDDDGTPDCIDGCPFDPDKIEPGVCGCGVADTDSDDDGTPDCVDGCPDDPGKITPGICGCGVPETDTDGDGTPNCVDGCPLDPDKIEPGICGCGVADADADGDGVPDCNDNCELFNPDQADCDGNGIGDACEIDGPLEDCNGNGIPDICDILSGFSQDCNGNNFPDECDIALGFSQDCQPNGVPDECEADCNNNNVPDTCDIFDGTLEDCNGDGIPDVCQGSVIPGRPDPEGTGDRVLRGYIIGWATNSRNEQKKWNHLTGEALCIDYRDGAAWEYRAWTSAAVLDVPEGSVVGSPGEIRLDGVNYAAPFDQLIMPFQANGSIKMSGSRSIVVETDLTLHPVSVNVLKNLSTGPANTYASFCVWNENGTKFTGPGRCVQCWDQTLLRYFDSPANFDVETLQTHGAYARIDGVQDPSCDPGAVNPSAPEALLGTRVIIAQSDHGDRMMGGGNFFGEGAQEAVIHYDPIATPDERAMPASMAARSLDQLSYADLTRLLVSSMQQGEDGEQISRLVRTMAGADELDAVDHLFNVMIAKTQGFESNALVGRSSRAAVLGEDAARVTTSEPGSLLIFSNVELRWDVAGNLVHDTFISITNHADEDTRVQFYFINGDPPIPFDPDSELCSQPGWNFVDNEILLRANEPTYWSVLTGGPASNGPVSPFTILDE